MTEDRKPACVNCPRPAKGNGKFPNLCVKCIGKARGILARRAMRKAGKELKQRLGTNAPTRGEYALTHVVSDNFVQREGQKPKREMMTIPSGAYARPLWSMDIPQKLKETGALYGAYVETVERGGEARAVDVSVIRVDGGKGGDPELSRMIAVQRLKSARDEIGDETVFPPAPALDDLSIPKMRVTSRMLLDAVCVHERSIASLLRFSGRVEGGGCAKKAREVLIDVLERISDRW